MAHVLFWEKPGCATNARQRAALLAAGHSVEALDLLHWPWTAETLLAFLSPSSVATWFNRAAPRIKRGELDPERLSRDEALALLLSDPLLIRRPLMQSGCSCVQGFDPANVHAWIGLAFADAEAARSTLERCSHPVEPCPVPLVD